MKRNLNLIIMKKNTFSIILALIVGIAAGYLIRKMSAGSGSNLADPTSWTDGEKEAFRNNYNQTTLKFGGKITPNPINNTKAKGMIKDFRTENERSPFPLLTVKKEPLRGFYIDRPSLEDALKAPGATGISFYFARADGTTAEKTYTLVFIGANNRGTDAVPDITNNDGTKGENQAQDYIKPCPDHCGDFN
jgi:hypothetical protein